MPISECARVLGLKRSTVSQSLKTDRERGHPDNLRCGGSDEKLNDAEKERIFDELDNDCSKSLDQMVEFCRREFSKTVSKSTISRALKDFHYTIKRTHLIPEARLSANTIEDRFNYASRMFQLFTSNRESVSFIDEAGFNVSMRCKYGWAAANTNANIKVRR